MRQRRYASIAFAILAAIGFASGVSFFKITGIAETEHFNGCFTFGMLEILKGENAGRCLLKTLGSAAELSVMLVFSSLSHTVFLLALANVFCLPFKCGVTFECVRMLLGRSGRLEAVLLLVLILILIGINLFFTLQTLERRIYHFRYRHLDSSDGVFLKAFVPECICFILFFTLISFFAVKIKGGIYGLFNTIV